MNMSTPASDSNPQPHSTGPQPANAPSTHALWMAVMPHMDEPFLQRAFQSIGEPIAGIRVMRKGQTSAPSYAFIHFHSNIDMERVLGMWNNHVIPNSNPTAYFKLNYAQPGLAKKNMAGEFLPPNKRFSLYVGNLTPETDDKRLYEYFANRYPTAKSAVVKTDPQGASKCFGFVHFIDEGQQKRALYTMSGDRGLCGRPLKVDLAWNSPNNPEARLVKTNHYQYQGGQPEQQAGATAPAQGYPNWFYAQPYWPAAGWGAAAGTPQESAGYQDYNQWGWTQPAESPPQYPRAESAPAVSAAPAVTVAPPVQRAPPPPVTPTQYPAKSPDSEAERELSRLVDPGLELNIEETNLLTMAQSEEFIDALMESRWSAVDNPVSQAVFGR